jgi:hypothetical protein
MRTVTINKAAEIKGVSQQAIRAAIEKGKLKTVEVQVPELQITLVSLNKYEPNPNMKRAGRPRKSNGKPSRRYCSGPDGCGVEITEVDIEEAQACTNCGKEIK